MKLIGLLKIIFVNGARINFISIKIINIMPKFNEMRLYIMEFSGSSTGPQSQGISDNLYRRYNTFTSINK